MTIVPRPITGKPRHIIGRTRFKPLPAACYTDAPPVPRTKLTPEQIAALYNGRRYRDVRVPWEPLWHPPPLDERAWRSALFGITQGPP